MQISRFTASKPSKFAFASDEKSIRQPTTSFVRCYLNQQLRRRVEISEKIKPHEWEKLPWRWIVERTFGWMNAARRLAKEFEILVSIEEAMIRIAGSAVLLHRL